MSKLYVVRHGETDFNTQNRYAGTIDVELNENGIAQARNLAMKLNGFPIDIIVSSSKKRALKTAKIISENIGIKIDISDDFIERNIGIFEGLTRQDVKKKYSDLWTRNALYELDNVEHKGESINQVKSRVRKALNSVFLKYQDKNILLVTHGYVSRVIHGLLNNISNDELNKFLLGNCETAEYNIN